MSLIKLSNGVELSEDTVVAALKKAGIETNPPESKFGDIVTFRNGDRRIWLYDNKGKLGAFDRYGTQCGGNFPIDYKPTGQNIFTDNLLGLNY